MLFALDRGWRGYGTVGVAGCHLVAGAGVPGRLAPLGVVDKVLSFVPQKLQ